MNHLCNDCGGEFSDEFNGFDGCCPVCGSGDLDQEAMTPEQQVQRIAKHIHYPECWDTMAYPTLADAVREITYCDPTQCSHKNKLSG